MPTVSRREFLLTGGALVVSFNAAQAQGPFDTHPSHIDPKQLASWLAIAANGTVTAHTGKCDLGQGMYTAQTQLVAEELCVPLASVKLLQCDTDTTPDQGTTSGSQSSPTNFRTDNLALAAATARQALVEKAAAKWNLPAEQLSVTDGVITAPAGHRITYAQLVEGKQFHLTLSSTAKRRPQSQWTVLGKPVPSLDRPALMTGRFEFVQFVKVPGMLHGRVVRPPNMGATLSSVDRDSVRDIPGAHVVVRNNFVGVVAPTQPAAIRAARQLAVTWTPGPELPAHADFYNHLQTQPSQDQLAVDSGNANQALTAGQAIRAKYLWPYQMHGSVGPSCAVADVRGSKVTVWSPTQSVYPTRSCISKILNVPLENVRVIFRRGSGCYGLNGADSVSFDAAVLSHAVGKPVRLQFSREDEMLWENLGAAVVTEHRATLSPDGTIAAWDREGWEAALGNRPGYESPGNVISGTLLGYEPDKPKPAPAKPPEGKFRNQNNAVPDYMAGCVAGTCGGGGTITNERVLTHRVLSPFFTGPLRAPLRIQNTFANECFMDELAAHAKADPVAFRLKHLKDPRLIGVVEAAAKAARWEARPSGGAQKNAGRGIACVNYSGGNGYAAVVADVEVNRETGEVHPKHFFVAIDAGAVSNPDGLRNQTEGGLLQGMSRTLIEEVKWDSRRITTTDWVTYPVLYLDYEMPQIEVVIVEPPDAPATGAGETAITVVAPAIANAFFDATGVRLRQVPLTPERVKAALA